jgi:hypothetical protein
MAVLGLILNFIGTICLAKGLLVFGEEAQKLAGTYYDINPHLAYSLTDNRNWALAGLACIALGFLCQLVGELRKKGARSHG